jgi:hypothetical protein
VSGGFRQRFKDEELRRSGTFIAMGNMPHLRRSQTPNALPIPALTHWATNISLLTELRIPALTHWATNITLLTEMGVLAPAARPICRPVLKRLQRGLVHPGLYKAVSSGLRRATFEPYNHTEKLSTF